MQTQEIYHAVKSFILDKTNGPTVINVPYDNVLFSYATYEKYNHLLASLTSFLNSSPEHININLTIILVSFIPPHHT